jgi:bifunctional non-homologous end joining protein LigD
MDAAPGRRRHHRAALRDRKALLRQTLEFTGPLRLTPHRNAAGEAYHRQACAKGWEGLIAKRADAPYQGTRSRDRLKLKCVNQQELVIGGWTDPAGKRIGLGALLVGYYDRGRLRYAGKVGTGYSDSVLRDLSSRLAPLRRPLGAAAARRPDRLHRGHRRRQAAPPALPGASPRQAPRGGGAGAAGAVVA